MNTPVLRHWTACALGAALLLGLGACASNRPYRGDDAAGRRATPNLDEASYYAPGDGGAAPRQNAEATGGVLPIAAAQPGPARPAEDSVAMEDTARGRMAAPIVPAFPAKLEQKRLRDVKTVYFEFDKAELAATSKRLLDANAAWLKAHPGTRVRIEGHCDERGTSEYNLALGSRRAARVREYLLRQGVPSGSFVIVSYGAEKPLRTGHDETAWRWNRRVEFSPVEEDRAAWKSGSELPAGG